VIFFTLGGGFNNYMKAMVNKWLGVAMIGLASLAAKSQVVINEFLASNGTGITDPQYGANSDWIELYNNGSAAVDLTGYYLSDNIINPTKWQIPEGTIIGSKSYLLLWADGKNNGLHTNFSLSAAGESLILSSPSLAVLDSYTFSAQIRDISMGRMPNGTGDFVFYQQPSPGAANSADINYGLAPQPLFSLQPGFYSNDISIELSSSVAGAEIYFTTDGSEPSPSKSLYTAPIELSSTTVIRAMLHHPQYMPGRINSGTFFVGEKDYNLPVVSLAVDPYDMFDPITGMYMPGPNPGYEAPYFDANYWQDREEPCSFEFFEEAGSRALQVNAGVKIFGGWSRAMFDQKSLSITGRGQYGDEMLDYQFFPDKNIHSFKSIVLRNSGNDNPYSMMRDAAMQAMVKDRLDVDYQAYRASVVFINGRYWGILNIRERLNEHYISQNYGIEPNKVEFLKNHFDTINGSDAHYRALFEYVRTSNLSNQESYEYVKTQMDVDQYIDYLITQTFFANADWPDNNVRYWRRQGLGGRWRWVVFDLDFGLGIWGNSAYVNALPHAFGGRMMSTRSWIMQDWGTMLNAGLIQSDEFKNSLIQRYSHHIGTTFVPERTRGIIDQLAAVIEPEMPDHKRRWGSNMYSWDIGSMKSWVEDRPGAVMNDIRSYFSVDTRSDLTVSSTIGGQKILLSGMEIPAGQFSSRFFNGVPVYLHAVPLPGYSFSHWETAAGAFLSAQQKHTLSFSSDTHVRAVFVQQELISNIFINEVLPSNKQIIADENGQFEDIIELYNGNDFPVNLGGMFLSDDRTRLDKWMVPNNMPEITTIPARGFLIFFADNDSLHGPLHPNFKLSASGDTVILSQRIGSSNPVVIDEIGFGPMLEDVSYGHFPDGSGNLDAFISPSPGAPNVKNAQVAIEGLHINEFMASNGNTVSDQRGVFADWIEIYNSTSQPVNIGGLYFTDDFDNPFKFRIPTTDPLKTTIAPKGFLVLWADGDASPSTLHLSFKISAAGGYLGLNQKLATGANLLSDVVYGPQLRDISYGPAANGGLAFKMLLRPTPGASNIDAAYTPISGLKINELLPLNLSGQKDGTGAPEPWIELHYGGSGIVNLAGLYITDNIDEPYKYTITRQAVHQTTLSSGDKMCVWASGQRSKGLLHSNFRLSEAGGSIYIHQYSGTGLVLIDSINYAAMAADQSYGRFPDGSASMEIMPPTFKSANLSNLSISYLLNLKADTFALSPAFMPDFFAYSVALPPGYTGIPEILPTAFTSKQDVDVAQAASLQDTAIVTVVSENGAETSVYKVSFWMQKSSDSKLSDISLSKGELVPAFSPDVFSYYVTFEGETIPPIVGADASYPNSTVNIVQSQGLPGVSLITVNAEDGTQSVYTVNFTTGPLVVEGFTEDFNDNFNNGWLEPLRVYTFDESDGEMKVKVSRTGGTYSWKTFKYVFPLKIVNMSNYPYLSVKMKVPSGSTEVRLDLRDDKGYTTNSSEHRAIVNNTSDFVEYYFDFSGRFYQQHPADKQGPVDYTRIVELVMFFDPGVSGTVNKTVVFDDLKIGKDAYKPENDARLVSLDVEGHTLFPRLTPQ
jgi:hypothetical protein